MNLVGNLEDLGLGEILQIVSLSRKSGILSLKGRRGEGEIVFRNGEVVCAVSPACPESLAELLAGRGKIDCATMERLLAEQEEKGLPQPIEPFLSTLFKIPAETIAEVIRNQVEKAALSFFEWKSGTFDFELQEHGDPVDSIEAKRNRFILSEGINSQYLALEGARRLDAKLHRVERPVPTEAGAAKISPYGRGEEPEPVSPEVAASPAAGTTPESETRHAIVLVEGEAVFRETLATSLEECGYEVYPFSGGADSPLMRLASLHRDGLKPTLLIDMQIPRMDGSGRSGGIELLELVRSNFPDTPLLVMTDRHAVEEEQLKRSGLPTIVKPAPLEVADPGVFSDFMAGLIPELKRVRTCGGAPEAGDKINLGEELSQEMGEESTFLYAPVVQSTGIALLRGMLEELRDPALEGGIILLVLRFASEFMNRGVIFMVKKENIEGLGQFGITAEGKTADSIVRGMKIPRKEDSIFSRVIETGVPIKMKPDDAPWTRRLLEKLGGEEPEEVFVGPIVSEEKVVALLYGDNIPDHRPIGDTDSLEIFLSQAGVAMEKTLLQRKLKGKGLEVM